MTTVIINGIKFTFDEHKIFDFFSLYLSIYLYLSTSICIYLYLSLSSNLSSFLFIYLYLFLPLSISTSISIYLIYLSNYLYVLNTLPNRPWIAVIVVNELSD